jgi:uncharacterized damage-inducible protein DinB
LVPFIVAWRYVERMNNREPWLRGSIEGVSPLVAPLFHSFQQAREDLQRFTEGLTTGQIWTRYDGLNSVGREMRHIGGSVDRLTTYLKGQQLDEKQLSDLKSEAEPGASLEELLAAMNAAFERTETVARALDVAMLTEPREVGRKRLPTTAIGLIVHMAEHTQRHVGQAIVAAKLVRFLVDELPA